MKLSLPIAWRLATMFAITAAVVFSGVAFFLYHFLSDSIRAQVRSELEFHHTLLDPVIETRHTEQEWQFVHRKLDGMAQEGSRVRYWIKSPDARYSYGEPFVLKTGWKMPESQFGFVKVRDPVKIWAVLSRTIPAYEGRPPIEFLVALDATAYIETKENFTRVMGIASGLGILLVAVLGYWIAKLGLLPVRRLSRQAYGLPPNNPRERLDIAGLPPEIRELAVSFNNALERRESAWLQLEGFNADVAHELRTPLTNLIGQTQVALARERDLGVLQDVLESNLEELERMSSIVNDMLFLSCAENGHRAAELSEFSLQKEAQKTVEYVEYSFAERHLAVRVQGDVQVRADKRLFHRALANLLSNSARHAHADTEVTVSIEARGEYVWISVSDRGDPIPADQQSRLFERFYRGDAARTRSGVHHGLGLSIVRAIASMHGGTVFVRSAQGINTFGFSLLRSI
ncbi:heavy metal sensor histidine kinase [Bordetella sp. BOR01]|uniref:heavy metal sensor histidine kinase n=1 Tax=Bordetella sp. BOR01 TaxID=2854779 RepID=UPI001C46A453|nr:heavy metal sensor histidine kinase [Bordetella sp. BOR01]MBV7484878.1 heavy metal sensor histidine kinase [Bordetella sp. BOR01]